MARLIALPLILAALVSASANAAIVTYSDRSTFIAATGAAPIGPIPANVPGAGFLLGGLTFSNVPPSTFNSSLNWSSLISEPFDLALNDRESFDVAAAGPIFSFGFDFHEPSNPASVQDGCYAPCVDSTFTVTLRAGLTLVDSFTFNRPDDVLAFVGVASSLAFDRIEIRETIGGIDDEYFGNFLIGRTPVPEPATIALLGFGLLALGLARRRRPG